MKAVVMVATGATAEDLPADLVSFVLCVVCPAAFLVVAGAFVVCSAFSLTMQQPTARDCVK